MNMQVSSIACQILVGIATFAGVIIVGIGLCWLGFYLDSKK